MTDDELVVHVHTAAQCEPQTREWVDAVLALEQVLADDPALTPARMIVAGRAQFGFVAQRVAQILMLLTKETGDASSSVAWFRRLAAAEGGQATAVKALHGIECAERVELAPDIHLVPILDLERSPTVRMLLDPTANHAFSQIGAPFAALCCAGTVPSAFVPMGVPIDHSDTGEWFDKLDIATRLLALVGDAVPFEAAHWFEYGNPDVNRFVQGGLMRYVPELAPSIYTSRVTVTQGDVEGLLPSFRSLRKSDADRISLALDRLIRSRSQIHPGNRAIDVAIALEVLFMNQDRDEHSYKISLRAARLLGASSDERRRIQGITKAVYDLRSTMVHTGRAKEPLKAGMAKLSAYDVVTAADAVLVRTIRDFLRRGEIPKAWPEIELA
jgi:hypothetical protein